jgi:hypothetical protein
MQISEQRHQLHNTQAQREKTTARKCLNIIVFQTPNKETG